MRWWEIVGMEEPSGDTPSVTPFGRASSLREGAGSGCGECVPFNRVLAKPQGFGRFSSPLRRLWLFYLLPFNRVLAKPQGFGRFSSPLRRAGAIHRAARKPQDCGRFSSPLRNSEVGTFYHSSGHFHRPKGLVILPFTIYWGVLPRVNWYFIISVWRSRCMTPSAILRMSRDATKARVFSVSSRGTL